MLLILERLGHKMNNKKRKEPLLNIQNLSVSFHAGKRIVEAVKKVSFQLEKGKTMAIVGESGSGKSVSALSILQLLPYPTAFHPSGQIFYNGKDLLKAKEHQMRKVRGNEISMIFQEPMTSLNPLHNIEKQINEVLILHKNMNKVEARKRTLELLNLVGISEPEKRLNSLPHELSGGQRQRVMIAMALANEPDLLIADEPTTALDVTIQAQILKLLKELQDKLGMAILFITHDLNIVKKFAHDVIVMSQGKIVEAGKVEKVFKQPKHSYTKHLLSSEPEGTPPPIPQKSSEILQGDNIKVWFPIKAGIIRHTVDHIKAVDGINVNIRAGETLGIVGESGSGKTTLGLALLRLIHSEGKIVFQSQNLLNLKTKALRSLRKEMQVVFQDPYSSLSPRLSIAQIIEEGLTVHKLGKTKSEREKLIIDVLKEVDLDPEVRFRYPHEFSGGQRQRIAIARALILKPSLIVLDEPTSALDRSVQTQIIDLLQGLQKRYKLAYLFISHDLKVIRAISHKVIVMKNGKVVEEGKTKQIFDKPKHDYTKALMKAAFDLQATETGIVNL